MDTCTICGVRGSGYRRVAYPFQEVRFTEDTQAGVILQIQVGHAFPPGRVCWRHNYRRAEPLPEQLQLFDGGPTDERLSNQG